MIALVCVLLMFLLLAVGAPISFAMMISGALGLFLIGGTTALFAIASSFPRETASVFEFVTVPMFLLMAELVLRSADAARLEEAAGKVREMVAAAHAKAGVELPA